jgi:voltage-gated potassium channel Kch
VAAFVRRLDRVVLGALLGLVAVVAMATLYFARALSLRPIDALYFVWTTVMTVGYGDISLKDAPDGVKLVGMALMLAGAASMAVLFAFFTGWVVTRRLAVHEGRVRIGGRGHVVIVGAGNVGTRVSALLAKAGRRVVLVERDSQCRNLGPLRADGHHVILADAASGPVLELAGVTRAAALLVLTESDTTNLHVAFVARAQVPDLPVIMRAESTELPNHVTEQKDAVALSPIAIAAEAFTLAVLDRGEVR